MEGKEKWRQKARKLLPRVLVSACSNAVGKVCVEREW